MSTGGHYYLADEWNFYHNIQPRYVIFLRVKGLEELLE